MDNISPDKSSEPNMNPSLIVPDDSTPSDYGSAKDLGDDRSTSLNSGEYFVTSSRS